MPSNKLLEKVNELDTLVSNLKGNYTSLIEAVKADPDVGIVKAQEIQELADYISLSAGGLDSLGSRFLMSEDNIAKLVGQINDIKSIDLRYIREQIDSTIGSYGSLKEAVKNSKAIDVIVNEGAISLDITSFNGVINKEVSVRKLSSIDVQTNIDPMTAFLDLLVKEQKEWTSNNLNLMLTDSFKLYNQTYGVFDGNGYRINQIPLGSLVDFSLEEYKQDMYGHQLVKSKNFNVLGMVSRMDDKSDIRNIFRKSEDLALGHFEATIMPGSITTVIMMKRPIYMDFIRIYPYTSVAKNKFKVTVYDENESIIGEISSGSFSQSSHNYDDFVDLQIDDVVHYVVLELISFSNVATLIGFNKIEFYEPTMPVEKDLFITEGVDIKPLDLLNGLDFEVKTEYYKTRSAKIKFGLYLNQEPYVMVEASKSFTAKDFTDMYGFRAKKDSLSEFSPTSQFKNTYTGLYLPLSTTFGTMTGIRQLLPKTPDEFVFERVEADESNFVSIKSVGPLIIETKDGFISDPISFALGERTINVKGQILKVKSTKMNDGCRRIIINEEGGESTINGLRFRLNHDGFAKNYGGAANSTVCRDLSVIIPGNGGSFKGFEMNHNLPSFAMQGMGSMFSYFLPSNLNQSNTTILDNGSNGYEQKRILQTDYVTLPVTFYIGEKADGGSGQYFEKVMTSGAYKHKILDDIQLSQNQTQFDRRMSEDSIDLLKQKVGYYFKEIQADLYPDGFGFSDTICSANTRFAIETGNKYKIFTNGSWKDILFEEIRTQGMLSFELNLIDQVNTKNKFFGKIKLVIFVDENENFTSTKIETLYKSLVKCSTDDILENGMSETEIALIDKNYIYSVTKESPIVNIGIIGSNSFKGEICPALKKVCFSMNAISILRKPNNTENTNLSVEYYPDKVRISNLSETDYNLVVKMLEPQKSKVIDNNTVQDLEEIIIKADQLSESTESINNLIKATTKVTKGYVDNAILSTIASQQDVNGMLIQIYNELEMGSITSTSFIRFMGDRANDFIGQEIYGIPSNHSNGIKLAMNLGATNKIIKTPIVNVNPNTLSFDYKIKSNKAPLSITLIVNESIRLTTGVYIENEVVISKKISDLSNETQVSIEKLQVELEFQSSVINETINVIPNMTSNIAPYGVIYASMEYDPVDYAAWRAFDGTLSKYGWLTKVGTPFGHIGYRFQNSNQKRIGKVILKVGGDEVPNPNRIKITGILNGYEFTIVDWFVSTWAGFYSSIIREFEPQLCDDIRVYVERPGGQYVGLAAIEVYEKGKDVVIFDYINYIPIIKGIKENEGAITMKQYLITIPSDGIQDLIVCESLPMNYKILLNGIEQENGIDYNLEQRVDGCHLIWNSQDFDLEIDDELVLITT